MRYYSEQAFFGDLMYVCVEGNDLLPEMNIGRFPADNAQELQIMIENTINYIENPPEGEWRKTAVFTAHFEGAPGRYQECKDYITHNIVNNSDYNIIEEYPFYGSTKYELLNALNKGISIFNYRGHGWTDKLGAANENVDDYINKSDFAYMTNGNKKFVVFAIACMTADLLHTGGKYDPTPGCIGAESLKNPNGGAVAYFGSTDVSSTSVNNDLDKNLFEGLFQLRIENIGELRTYAITKLITQHSPEFAHGVMAEYIILGDPTLPFFIPNTVGRCGIEDCNDNDPSINPAMHENCFDKKDNDCDGKIDEEDSECIFGACNDVSCDDYNDEEDCTNDICKIGNCEWDAEAGVCKETQQFIDEDVNQDGKVDIQDLIIVGQRFGAKNCATENNYCERADISRDSKIDIQDLIKIGLKFGYGKV